MHEIVGVFLFYKIAVEPLMLTAINKIGSRQAKLTSLVKTEIELFLQFANKHHDTTLLVCHSETSHLIESEASSRAGDILFLGDCAPGEILKANIAYISVITSTVVPYLCCNFHRGSEAEAYQDYRHALTLDTCAGS